MSSNTITSILTKHCFKDCTAAIEVFEFFSNRVHVHTTKTMLASSLLAILLLVWMVAGVVISNILVRPAFYLGSNHNGSSSNKNDKSSKYNSHRGKRKRLAKNLPCYDGYWRIDSKRNGLGNPKSDLNLEYEDVEFPLGPIAMPGNTTLRGWFIPAQDISDQTTSTRSRWKRKDRRTKKNATSRKVSQSQQNKFNDRNLCVVICHGGGRDRRQHLRHVRVLMKYGVAVLMFDKQEHGISDGQERGIGWFSYEGSDMFAACKYAKWKLKFSKVVAMGTSFGAAGALTAAGFFDESGTNQIIDAVIAENPPYGRFRFVRDCMHMHGNYLPAFARELLALSVYICLSIRRANLTLPDPSDTIKNIAPRPLLITHSKSDSVVPFAHGLELYEQAMEPKDCLWVSDCAHTLIFNKDPIRWEAKVSALLYKVSNGRCEKSSQADLATKAATVATTTTTVR